MRVRRSFLNVTDLDELAWTKINQMFDGMHWAVGRIVCLWPSAKTRTKKVSAGNRTYRLRRRLRRNIAAHHAQISALALDATYVLSACTES
jgi:hypothetical protein